MIYMDNQIKEHKNNNLIKNHEVDAGYDIRSGEGVLIPPGCSAIIETGLHVCIPPIMAGIIQSRSGLAIKHSVECSNAGVIDSGYQGAIKIKLYNHDLSNPYRVSMGDRIAQMVFHIVPEVFFQEINAKFCMAEAGWATSLFPAFKITEKPVSEWPDSDRGSNGFGSSGR